LALGSALKSALGDRAGIGRYGFSLPMDEASATVMIDLSGRPATRFEAEFPVEQVGELQTQMISHFFESLAMTLGASIHIEAQGENAHHMIEAIFKSVGRALRPSRGPVFCCLVILCGTNPDT
jgi:imidazoleglycerol phosphate dehydratase HisB